MNTSNPKEIRQYPKQNFKDKENNHVSNEEKYYHQCDQCNKIVASKDSLMRHIKLLHVDNKEEFNRP